jgi:hypothetical protein
MGIKGLAQLIADISPWAIKETEIKNYFGRKVAVDASKNRNLNFQSLEVYVNRMNLCLRHVFVSISYCCSC